MLPGKFGGQMFYGFSLCEKLVTADAVARNDGRTCGFLCARNCDGTVAFCFLFARNWDTERPIVSCLYARNWDSGWSFVFSIRETMERISIILGISPHVFSMRETAAAAWRWVFPGMFSLSERLMGCNQLPPLRAQTFSLFEKLGVLQLKAAICSMVSRAARHGRNAVFSIRETPFEAV
jgi:hypothetical protein